MIAIVKGNDLFWYCKVSSVKSVITSNPKLMLQTPQLLSRFISYKDSKIIWISMLYLKNWNTILSICFDLQSIYFHYIMMMKILRLQASDRNYINSVLRTSICILSGSRQDHLECRAFHTSCINLLCQGIQGFCSFLN